MAYPHKITVPYLEQVDVHLRLAADHVLRFFPTKHLQHLKRVTSSWVARSGTYIRCATVRFNRTPKIENCSKATSADNVDLDYIHTTNNTGIHTSDR